MHSDGEGTSPTRQCGAGMGTALRQACWVCSLTLQEFCQEQAPFILWVQLLSLKNQVFELTFVTYHLIL